MRRPLVLSLLPALACAVALAAGPAPSADGIDGLEGSAKLDALIARVVRSQRAVRALRANFVQRTRSELLLDDVVSSGEFFYRAPDKVRWDYRRPDPMVVLFSSDTVTTFHPLQSKAERIKVSDSQRRFVRVVAGTQPLDDLLTHFSVTLADPGGGSPYLLTLRPLDRTIQKKLHSLSLEVDRTMFLPVVVEYDQADGDSTRYEFIDLEINPELDDAKFRLDLGPEVELQSLDASAGLG